MDSPTYEGGLVVGNTYDKYGTSNPVARLLMRRFLWNFDELVNRVDPSTILEVGCGEGHLTRRVSQPGRRVLGTDISRQMIDLAQATTSAEHGGLTYMVADLFELDPAHGTYDLVVCCEVLEHLADPERALAHLRRLSKGRILVSVPREPIWRLLNMARGKYLTDWGNTPGHVQGWSRRSFLRLVRRHLNPVEVRSPLPWTMVLAGPSDVKSPLDRRSKRA